MGQVMPKQEQPKAKEGCEVQQGEKKLKPCCACPETKKVFITLFFSLIFACINMQVRDQCIVERGEENCKAEIEAHKACMRAAGFNI